MSRLIRVFTVLFVNLFSIPLFEIRNNQGRCPNLAVCPNIPDFTLFTFYLYIQEEEMDVLPCRLLLRSQHFNYRYSMVSIYISNEIRQKSNLKPRLVFVKIRKNGSSRNEIGYLFFLFSSLSFKNYLFSILIIYTTITNFSTQYLVM